MTAANAHTPGEWTVVPQSDGSMLIVRQYDTGEQMRPIGMRIVAQVFARGTSLDEDKANGRLIASAPALLAALQRIVDANQSWRAASDRFSWNQITRDEFERERLLWRYENDRATAALSQAQKGTP